MQFRECVTHHPGLECYQSTRFVPPEPLTNACTRQARPMSGARPPRPKDGGWRLRHPVCTLKAAQRQPL